MCTIQFSSCIELNDHIILEHGNKPFKCKECAKTFLLPASLKSHMKTHAPEYQHVCSVCGKQFASLGHIKQHMIAHRGYRIYECNTCGKAFTRKNEYEKHLDLKHGSSMWKQPCDVSTSKTGRLGSLKGRKVSTDEFAQNSVADLEEEDTGETCVPEIKKESCPVGMEGEGTLEGNMSESNVVVETLHDCYIKYEILESCSPSEPEIGNSSESSERSNASKLSYCEQCCQCFTSAEELQEHLDHHLGDNLKREFTASPVTRQLEEGTCQVPSHSHEAVSKARIACSKEEVQGNPVITRSSGPPTLPRYNRYLVINKHMIKYIKCNAWDYTLISYITTFYYYNYNRATVMICFVTRNQRKLIISSLFGFILQKQWYSKQLNLHRRT